MTIYVAGSWASRNYVREVTDYFRSHGIDCVNAWMDREAITVAERASCAAADLAEVERADALVLLTKKTSTAGGMHFESGYAFAKGKRVIVIGQRSGVFHCLPSIGFFATPQQFVAWATKNQEKVYTV